MSRVVPVVAAVVLLLGGRIAADDAKSEPDPAKLVRQLGGPEFTGREAAGRALRTLGMKAEPAVRDGVKSADPEVARRSAGLLLQILADERWAAVGGAADRPTPAWAHFREVVGDTAASRDWFVKMAAGGRYSVLDRAARDPAGAAELYAAEVARVGEARRQAFDPLVHFSAPRGREHSLQAVPPGDVLAVLFLGSFPLPDGAPDPDIVHAFLESSFVDLTGGPLKDTPRTLYAAWLDRRRSPAAVESGLEAALVAGVPEAASVARRVLADPNAPVSHVGRAATVLGRHGTPADLPRLAGFRDDARPYDVWMSGDEIQVRDMAAAASLELRGRDMEEYGFTPVTHLSGWADPNVIRDRRVSSFKSAEVRAAAHKKAWDWLDRQPKPPVPAGKP